MSEVRTSKSITATEPVINMINPVDRGDISWEVKDGEDDIIPGVDEEKEESPKETGKEEKEETDAENIDEESSEDNEEDEELEEDKPKKKKIRNSKDNRFADFTRKIRNRDELLKESYARQSQLERELALEKQEKIKVEAESLKNYMQTIERAHATALEDGDNEKAAEASRLMAQYAARHETKMKEVVNIPQPQPHIQETDNNQLIYQSEEFQRNGKDWIKKNQWADQSSSNFNPRLLSVAEEYVNQLIDHYTFEERGEEIGTADFFDEISNHVKETIGIGEKKTTKDKMFTAPKGQASVSPVSRKGSSPNITKQDNEIVLTPEQIKIADGMMGLKFNGQRINDKQTLRNMYKEQLKILQRG